NWAGGDTHPFWSGTIAGAQGADNYQWVRGQWIVPHAHGHSEAGFASAAQWIGIGGFSGPGLIQAGTGTDVFDHTGGTAYLWWEWLDADSVSIITPFAFPGDVMHCLICAPSATAASIYFANVSFGAMTWFSLTPPPKALPIDLHSVEWIVERPTLNNSLTDLADYALVYFDEAVAGTVGNQTIPLGSGF